jgi:Flp pilus assembly protein TadD
MTSVQLRYWQNSITLLERAVQVVPGNSMAHVMLGNAYFEGGQLDGALREYEEARRLRQNDPLVWDRVGVVLMQQNKAAEALPCFDTAIRIAPGWPEPRRQMALALLRLGRDAEARTIYQTLASLMPATAESRRDLADLLAEGRQFSDAIDSYREALRLKPDFQAALNNLAWLRACCPQAEFRNGGEAVELAERACQLSQHHNADFLGTLAAAYAEAGRFDAALDRVQKALFLAQGSSSTNLLRQMLEQFRAGKPFRK